MSLSAKQAKFAQNIAKLIIWADKHGYHITLGEAYRPPELAETYARRGIGIANSRHCSRLAIDLNLFKNGQYLQATKDHAPLGEYWKSLDKNNRWGGDFKRPDGNHYEMTT